MLVHVGEQPLHGPFIEDVAHVQEIMEAVNLSFSRPGKKGAILNNELLDIQGPMYRTMFWRQ